MLEKVWRKGNPPALLVVMYIDTATMENSMEVPSKTKNRTTIWASNPTTGHIPWENHNSIETGTTMFIAALFTIARTCLQPKYPSTDERVKRMWYIYTIEYCSTIKRNKIELFVVRWMDLESVIQNEVCHKEKNKYHMLIHIYGI